MRRLESLERHAGHRTATEELAAVHERALQILSAADRELLPEVNLLLTRVITRFEVGAANADMAQLTPQLSAFVASLSTVWRDGEVRPTHRKRTTGPRTYRTRVDPF